MIGYEVRLSNNHTCNGHPFTDICDELAGKYPKWFKFTKWHPQCRCVCLAIFDDDPGAGEVRDVPANFKQWVTDNQPRLDRSIKKGTAPYWVRDNNRPLRGYDGSWNNFKGIGKVPLDNEDVNTPRQIKDLTNLIQRSPMLDDIRVERGVDSDGLKGFLGVDSLSESSLKSMIGKTVEDPAFMSCGAAKGSGFNGNVLNIYCPKGTRMYYFDGRSAYATENEILIQRGTKFRITKVETDGGKLFIDLEVVEQI